MAAMSGSSDPILWWLVRCAAIGPEATLDVDAISAELAVTAWAHAWGLDPETPTEVVVVGLTGPGGSQVGAERSFEVVGHIRYACRPNRPPVPRTGA